MEEFHPFRFEGRLGRLQYFGFGVIWGLIFFAVALAFGGDPAGATEPGAGEALASLALLVTYAVAMVSYGVRRLHDFDKSGAWYLLMFVPFANVVMGLILLFAPGTPGANRYGTRT
ncbi:MAG: DUF805 domain-containing protein [Trueperaceae bacterium]